MTNGDLIREALKNDSKLLDEVLSDYWGIVCFALRTLRKGDLDDDSCRDCPLYDNEKTHFNCLDQDKLHEWLLKDADSSNFPVL